MFYPVYDFLRVKIMGKQLKRLHETCIFTYPGPRKATLSLMRNICFSSLLVKTSITN